MAPKEGPKRQKTGDNEHVAPYHDDNNSSDHDDDEDEMDGGNIPPLDDAGANDEPPRHSIGADSVTWFWSGGPPHLPAQLSRISLPRGSPVAYLPYGSNIVTVVTAPTDADVVLLPRGSLVRRGAAAHLAAADVVPLAPAAADVVPLAPAAADVVPIAPAAADVVPIADGENKNH